MCVDWRARGRMCATAAFERRTIAIVVAAREVGLMKRVARRTQNCYNTSYVLLFFVDNMHEKGGVPAFESSA